jgi:hypothetical protein
MLVTVRVVLLDDDGANFDHDSQLTKLLVNLLKFSDLNVAIGLLATLLFCICFKLAGLIS